MARLSLRCLYLLVCVTLASPALASAGRLGGGGSLNISLTRIVLALLLCVMIAGLAALALKRSGGRIDLTMFRRMFASLPSQRRIEVIETRRVSQYADVCLLRCDGREYLLLCAQHQQTVLREGPVEPAPETQP